MTESLKSRWWALAALNLAVLAVGLDGTVLTVALPTLAGALHATESDLQWFTSGYLLVLAAGMLPAALLGDRFGRRTVLIWSLGIFAIGSAACAFAPSAGVFIAIRTVLGAAGAGVIVMSLSSISVLFSQAERPKAIGLWSAANFLATPIGPILGGWLLSHYWWGWVFLLNLPIAAIGLGVVARLVPQYRPERRPRIDWAGIAISTVGLVAVTYGLIEAGEQGWGAAVTVIPIVVGLAALAVFVRFEQRVGEPLVDPRLFASRSYTWGVILVALGVLAMLGALFLMPQYFQGVLGTDAMGSGLRLLPLIGGLVLGAVPANVAVRFIGAKLTVAIGFAVLTAGLVIGTMMTASSGTWFIAGWMALVGFGVGFAVATASSAALAVLSEERSGIGSAVLQAVNKVGGPFGAAVTGSILLSGYQGKLHTAGLPGPLADAVRASVFGGVAVARQVGSQALLMDVRTAFADGIDRALVVSAGVGLAGVALALVFLPHRSDGSTPAQKEPDIAASTTAE